MPYTLEPPENFVQILQRVWWRLDRALDEDTVRASALVGGMEALLSGTTTLVDHHSSPNAIDGSLDERLAFVMPSFKLVLLGGLQEPAHGGATVTERLLQHPEQLAAVRSDPSLVPAAVEEGLRWTAPIGNLLRGVAPGTELGGVTFPPDARAIR